MMYVWIETDTYVNFFSFLEDLKKKKKEVKIMGIAEISFLLSILFN